MNILMLGRFLPPPRRPVRMMREYHLAHHLARIHRLTLSFVADNSDAAGAISTLRSEFGDLEFASIPRGWKSLASAIRLATGESCTLSYFRSQALRTRLADRLRHTRYDMVLVSSSTMIQYALDIDPAVPLVVDFGSVGSEWWMQQAARGSFPGTRFFRTEALRLRIAEAAAARRAALCVAETPEAARIVESLAPSIHARVIPSGMDVDAPPPTRPVGKVPTVLFNSGLGTDAELRDAMEFCRTIVPVVRARIPEARFVIMSKDPVGPARIRSLNGVEVIFRTRDGQRPFHDRAVAVAPLRAALDVHTSVLEPMSAGVPVVATSRVRAHLGAQAGRELIEADDPLEFAVRVSELLESTAQREKVGACGREFVRASFSWSVFAGQLNQLLVGVAGRSRARDIGPDPRPVPAVLGD
jgi:hypothetical protein